jgi:hypothetical protein
LRQDRNLHVHQRSDGKLITTEGPIVDPVFCIALSCNDKFVALGFAAKVWIFVVENREMIRHVHELPSMGSSNVESQRVCFSADGDKIIVATRYVGVQSNVSVYVSECTKPEMGQKFPPVNIPTVSRDTEILHIGLGALTSLTRALETTLGFLQYFMITAPATHA